MQLSRFSDYALRVLLYLAMNTDEKATLTKVSASYDISLEHLRKIIHELAKLGYIKTYRGKNGGFELNKTPEAINIGELLRLTEGDSAVIDCDSQPCRLTTTCTAKAILREAQNAFYLCLSKYTLEDLIKSRKMQRELINISKLN